jgi:ATP-dependent helicase HrpA
VHSLTEFKGADLDLAAELEALSPRAARARYDALPSRTTVRDREVEIDYDVEEVDGRPVGVAKLRLPEKIARTLTEAEIPALDRPVRYVVPRGQRGSVRASTLDELQTLLDQPWTEEEIARFNRKRDEQREAARSTSRDMRRDRVGREPKRGLRDRGRNQRPGRSEREARRDEPGSSERPNRPRGGKPRGGRGRGRA